MADFVVSSSCTMRAIRIFLRLNDVEGEILAIVHQEMAEKGFLHVHYELKRLGRLHHADHTRQYARNGHIVRALCIL